MAEPMLELKGVTAVYGRSMVLFDVDLTVPAGGAAADTDQVVFRFCIPS